MRAFGLFTLIFSIASSAQESPAGPKIAELITDRPDFTESTEAVPKGYLQWESGVQFDRTGLNRNSAFGVPLLRFGITKRFELRLSTDGFLGSREGSGPAAHGMGDPAIGIKYKFKSEGKWMPALAVIPLVNLPFGQRGFTSSTSDPGIKFAWAKDIPAGFSASGNVNYFALSDGGGRYNQHAASLSIGHGFTERFAGYWEIYSFSCDQRDSGRMTVFQTGLTSAVGQNTQLDLSVARRLTSVGPDWMIAFGWATRHPFGPASWLKK